MSDLHADTDTIARLLGDRLEEMLDALAPGWVQRRGMAYPRPHAEKGSYGSFQVVLAGPKRGQWYRHSQDVGGGVLRLFAYLHSGETSADLDRDVFEAARAFLGLPSPFGAGREVDEAEAAKRRAEAEARVKERSAEHARAAAEYRMRQSVRARDLWTASRDAAGTPVAAWLSARGLDGVAIPPSIRFHPAAPFFPGKGEKAIHRGPAMVAVVTDGGAPHGGFRGVHVTWLSADGRAKAEIVDPETGEAFPARRMIGPAKGGHVRLSPASKLLAVAEGIETALSIQHMAGLPTFAALSLNNLGAKLPAVTEAVVLCFDSDERQPQKAERMKEAAAREHAARGLAVRWCAAPDGMDFNDVAMKEAMRVAARVSHESREEEDGQRPHGSREEREGQEVSGHAHSLPSCRNGIYGRSLEAPEPKKLSEPAMVPKSGAAGCSRDDGVAEPGPGDDSGDHDEAGQQSEIPRREHDHLQGTLGAAYTAADPARITSQALADAGAGR